MSKIHLCKHFDAYLSRADNNAVPRPYWFGTQAEALTGTLCVVCTSHLCLLTLLSAIRSTLSPYSHRLALLQTGTSFTFSPKKFRGTVSLRSSGYTVFTLDDVLCIGQGLLH